MLRTTILAVIQRLEKKVQGNVTLHSLKPKKQNGKQKKQTRYTYSLGRARPTLFALRFLPALLSSSGPNLDLL